MKENRSFWTANYTHETLGYLIHRWDMSSGGSLRKLFPCIGYDTRDGISSVLPHGDTFTTLRGGLRYSIYLITPGLTVG